MMDFDKFWLGINKKLRIFIDIGVFGFVGYLILLFGLANRIELWLFYIAMFLLIIESEYTRTYLKQTGLRNVHFIFTCLFNLLWLISISEYLITGRFVNIYVSLTGFAMVLIGLWLHVYVFMKLGKFYSDDVEVKKGHKVIKSGLYKNIRHPAYLGIFIVLFGLPLVVSSFRAMPISVAASIVVYYKTLKEEELLEKSLPTYIKYKKETGMYFPKLRGIKS